MKSFFALTPKSNRSNTYALAYIQTKNITTISADREIQAPFISI